MERRGKVEKEFDPDAPSVSLSISIFVADVVEESDMNESESIPLVPLSQPKLRLAFTNEERSGLDVGNKEADSCNFRGCFVIVRSTVSIFWNILRNIFVRKSARRIPGTDDRRILISSIDVFDELGVIDRPSWKSEAILLAILNGGIPLGMLLIKFYCSLHVYTPCNLV